MIYKRTVFLYKISFIACITLCLTNSQSDVTFDLAEKILEGEKYYEELTKSTFTYGNCWKKAVLDLHVGCKDLTQEVQSRLALTFANCFLEYSGSDTCPCPEEMPITSCLKNSSERIFATYREFFTHTQSICYFLQHKVWQEETAKTVQKLTVNSEAVSKKLAESSKFQSRILSLQHHAVQEQQKLISNGRILNVELDKSRTQAQLVFEEFKTSTNEQRMMIFEVFDRIRKLQTLVLGEFTGMYTFVYYLAASLVVYVLTSTPYTCGARIWLFLLMTANAILERVIAVSSMDEETEKFIPLETNGPIYYRIWLCRKLSCALGFLILLFFSLRYKDYNVINNKLLKELQQQNMEIQCFIKDMKKNGLELSEAADKNIEKHDNIKEDEQPALVSVTLPSPVTNEILELKRASGKKTITKRKDEQPALVSVTLPSPVSNEILALKRASGKKTITKPKEKVQNVYETSQEGSMLDLLASPGRYNLRSRTNSPAQSSIRMTSPETLCKEIKDSLDLSFENKMMIRRKIKKG